MRKSQNTAGRRLHRIGAIHCLLRPAMSYRLSLLDKSPLAPGHDAAAAMAATVDLARLADELGYHRFWLAEHHASDQLAGVAPEVLAAHLLARTRRIRVGSGGVMLQHYSPYKVAEVFRLLAALAPGRVDLGIGKAPGGLPLSTQALQQRREGDAPRPDFATLLAELDAWLAPADRPGQALVRPQPPQPPERFLLGASVESARLALERGWHFVYAGHFNGDPDEFERVQRVYGDASGRAPLLAVYALAADEPAQARAALAELRVFRVTLPNGQAVNLPTLAAADEFARQGGFERYRAEERRPHAIAGGAAEVRQALARLQARWGIDEFVIDTPPAALALRRRSVELLAPLAAPAPTPVLETQA